MSHTPAPWHVGYNGGITGPTASPMAYLADKCERQVVSARDPHFSANRCVCVIFDPADSQQQANARLISAAPQLLEALQDIHTLWDFAEPVTPNTAITYNDPSAINAAMAKALIAIRKATGGDL